MADVIKAGKLASARKHLKEFQQKNKETIHPGNKNISKNNVLKQPRNTDNKHYLEQNSVFYSGPGDNLHAVETQSVATSCGSRGSDSSHNTSVFSVNGDAINNELKRRTDVIEQHCPLNHSETIGLLLPAETIDNQQSTYYQADTSCTLETLSFTPASRIAMPSSHSNISSFSNSTPSNILTPNDFFDNFSGSFSASNGEFSNSVEESRTASSTAEFFTNTDRSSQSGLPYSSKIDNALTNVDSIQLEQNINVESNLEHSILNTKTDVLQNKMEIPVTSDEIRPSRSSTESLRQLMQQMNGLVNESVHEISDEGEANELEQRNQELAAKLAMEQQKSEQLHLQLKEYQSRTSQLEVDLDEQEAESSTRLTRELGPVQEQLQLHVQTVGILVGEKTELQAALSKSQQTAKHKAGEAEELQGKLKALRHRVDELEKEGAASGETRKQLDKSHQELAKEVKQVRLEQRTMSQHMEEKEEEVSELRQKLGSKSKECSSLREELQEKQSELSLTQLRVQQLSKGDSPETDGQLEFLHQRNISLERQVVELERAVRSISSERDQASQQYQQYVQQLNSQLQSLALKLESAGSENEQLSLREQSLVHHVSDLEKQLQLMQNQRRRDSPPRPQELQALQELEAKLAVLEGENETLVGQLNLQVQETSDIQKQMEDKDVRVEELELTLEGLTNEVPNTKRLLEAMESDKVAAARAVGQNQHLKQQLEELQNGFIQMSNNKLDLTEKLQHEQHICKEQGERLAQQESELNDLRNQLLKKEKLLEDLEQNSSELSSQVMQQNQVADRMRHYEAQGQLADLLQQELQLAKEQIKTLSTQNSELRTNLAQQSALQFSVNNSEDCSSEEMDNRKDDLLATLSASVRQLELERNQLLEQLQSQGSKEGSPEIRKETGVDSLNLQNPTTDADVKGYVSMKQAMTRLEERFMGTMREVADLSDEKQRLEHLVLQLQGETETIGEYIALYQVQRSILRQRAQEKDEQLSKLAQDREEMRFKLNELNKLVRRFVVEKDIIKDSHDESNTHDQQILNPKYLFQEESTNTQVLTNGDLEIDTKSLEMNTSTDNLMKVEIALPGQGKTASEIMALLTEIKSSSLVEPQFTCVENFAPCPVCSGRLITV